MLFAAIGNYAVFSGRAGRSEYWYFYILCFIVSALSSFITVMTNYEDKVSAVLLLVNVIFFIPHIAVSVRRLHDLNQDGGWALLSVIPVVSLLFMIIGFFDGTPGVNRYGPDPNGRGNSHPSGPGDHGAHDTVGTVAARPVQSEPTLASQEAKLLGLRPGDYWKDDEGKFSVFTVDQYNQYKRQRNHLGEGVQQDSAEASKRSQLAADERHAEAQVRLDELHPPLHDIEQNHVNPKPIEGSGPGLQPKSPDTSDSKTAYDDLEISLIKLKKLHSDGLIDDDEYKMLKVRILNQLS